VRPSRPNPWLPPQLYAASERPRDFARGAKKVFREVASGAKTDRLIAMSMLAFVLPVSTAVSVTTASRLTEVNLTMPNEGFLTERD
jgi:hypothetical protein